MGAVTWRDLRIAAGAVLACVSGDGRVGVVCTNRGGIGGGSINPEPGDKDLRAPFRNFSADEEYVGSGDFEVDGLEKGARARNMWLGSLPV
jgi:hypothetical protein